MEVIKKHIENGDLSEAIDSAISIADEKARSQLILQKSRLAEINKMKDTGQISFSEYSMHRNGITQGVLNILNSNESIIPSTVNVINTLAKRKYLILLIAFIVIALTIIILALQNESNVGIKGNNNDNNDIKIEKND
jgi:hypothetical protein